ncbi:cytochrome P450 [Aspergillus foveolatus]|uniref:cytochrome P450 n=1 Tax=Aspergillus foveolatus TaxID=210207 RepID=UPI003CCE1D66
MMGLRIVTEKTWALFSVGLILSALYIAGLAIYRLYFHPLARFPGPKLNAISSLPSISSLLRGRLGLETKQLHDRYGPVVRVSPNELAFNSAQAWEDIYGFKAGGRKNMHKDPIHVGSVDPLPGASTLTMADDENHARQRRAMSHSFSERALKEQEYIIQHYVDIFIAKLKEMADQKQEFNLVNWLNFTTFDIIGDLAFGEPFGCLDLGAFHSWVALIFETVKVGALEQATRRIAEAGSWTQTKLLNMIPAYLRQRRRDHLARSKEKVEQRLRNGPSEHKDFIYYVLRQKEKYDLHDNEIILNSALFIVAGSETTANLLSGLLARLLRNTDKMQKLYEEVRGAFQNEDEITYQRTSQLPYLNACLEEGLRIHPPVPTGLLRTVPHAGDVIDGHWVPGGTSVSVGGWAASHNPVNFRDCDTFIPERWLNDAYSDDIKSGMQPFSLGPRGCIGKNLSYMEMRIILARLVWNFDIISTDGAWQWDPEGEMKHMKAYTTWQKPDLNARVVRAQEGGGRSASSYTVKTQAQRGTRW